MSNVEKAAEVLAEAMTTVSLNADPQHGDQFTALDTRDYAQALIDAGWRLLPDDAKVTTEYGVRHKPTGVVAHPFATALHISQVHLRDDEDYVRRTVTTVRTEWQEVDDDD